MENGEKALKQAEDAALGLLLGLATGDALGVPVEFKRRGSFHVSSMEGYGTHGQPPGTWSDDTSLALALADNISGAGVSMEALAKSFIDWKAGRKYTPHGHVFDIGESTRRAIEKLAAGITPENSGGTDERDNGNGSLMRIAPLLFCILEKPLEERFELVRQVSAITHGHPVSVFSCFLYLEMLRLLYKGQSKEAAYAELRKNREHYAQFIPQQYAEKFARLLEKDIAQIPESEIKSSGYVVDTLEASFWVFLRNWNYKDTVLAAVNLGDDTDTTGAVAGAMAGLYYGVEEIPEEWLSELAKSCEIIRIAKKMVTSL